MFCFELKGKRRSTSVQVYAGQKKVNSRTGVLLTAYKKVNMLAFNLQYLQPLNSESNNTKCALHGTG